MKRPGMTKKRIFGTLDPFFEGGDIMGRKVANGDFLHALLQSGQFDEYHFFLSDHAKCLSLQSIFDTFPEYTHLNLRIFLRRELPLQLSTNAYYCFHCSDCINWPAYLAALRNTYSRQIFPITSLTHSLSCTRYLREMQAHVWAGTTARDCIVASSLAGQGVVHAFLAHARKNLGLEGDSSRQPGCQVIPLGITLENYPPPLPEERCRARHDMGIADDQVVLVVFGRVSPHSKMDILPLFHALQRVFGEGISRDHLCLVVAGWIDSGDEFPVTLETLARNMGLDMRLVPRPDEKAKRSVLSCADIFVSLADNPQETFGLTLLEAGAMELPVIASDFDGYRDIVVHGETGILVPTLGSEETGFVDAMAPLVSDFHYHLWLAQGVAVSVPDLAHAIIALLRDVKKRVRLGRAARQRIAAHFSWQRILREYEKLWEDLWQVPVEAEPPCTVHPLNLPYATIFHGYPCGHLNRETQLVWTRCGKALYHGQEFPLIYAGLEGLVDQEQVRRILFWARKPISSGSLVDYLEQECIPLGTDRVFFVIMWCLKHDLVEIVCAP